MSKVFITTVFSERPHSRFYDSLMRLQHNCNVNGIAWKYHASSGKHGVDEGHNKAVEAFLNSDCEWRFHVDSDATFEPETLSWLLKNEKKFCSALAFQRKPPYGPIAFTREGKNGYFRDTGLVEKYLRQHIAQTTDVDSDGHLIVSEEDSLLPVIRSGTHCVLIHRDIYEDISPPWHDRLYDSGAGSDFYFSEKASKAGYRIYVDMSVVSGHLQNDYAIGPIDFLVWSLVTDYTVDGQFRVHAVQGV